MVRDRWFLKRLGEAWIKICRVFDNHRERRVNVRAIIVVTNLVNKELRLRNILAVRDRYSKVRNLI